MLGVGIEGPVGTASVAVGDGGASPISPPSGPKQEESDAWAVLAGVRGLGPVGFGLLLRRYASGVEILREACESFIFVQRGRLTEFAGFDSLVADPGVRAYLGGLAPESH